MQPVRRVEGRAIAWGATNVDTDIIIPAEHLKTVKRSGLGAHAFETVRREPGNVFDAPETKGAPILIAGDNFGCGSSREHAVWAMLDLGLRAVIAPGYSDIFAGNAFRNGLVAVVLPQADVDRLLATSAQGWVAIDLTDLSITTSAGDRFSFTMESFRRESLLEGRDEIALTLRSEATISRYEAEAPQLAWAMGAPVPG